MVIREATHLDVNRLAELNALVQNDHFTNRPDQFTASDIPGLADVIRHHFDQPTSHIWIAHTGEEPVGYVLAIWRDCMADTFCHSRRWCEIDQIVVDPAVRNRGVARALLRAAAQAARTAGLSELELNTWAFNSEAQAVFRKLGFRPKVIRWEAPAERLASGHAEPGDPADPR